MKLKYTQQIADIVDNLCNHSLNKFEALNRLLTICASLDHEDPKINDVLRSSVNVIYFNDNSDYLAAHYSIVRKLTGLKELNDDVIKKLFKELNPDE